MRTLENVVDDVFGNIPVPHEDAIRWCKFSTSAIFVLCYKLMESKSREAQILMEFIFSATAEPMFQDQQLSDMFIKHIENPEVILNYVSGITQISEVKEPQHEV